MELRDDSGAHTVMERFGVDASALLGSGGEAWVLALGPERVLRIAKAGVRRGQVSGRTQLLAEIAKTSHRVPFAIPEVLEQLTAGGRPATVETRLPGRVLSEALGESRDEARTRLVHAYLDASSAIGDLEVERAWYGELARPGGLRAQSHCEYLEAAVARSLAIAGSDFASLDAGQLARALPECETPSLVHLDAFAGNMLTQDGRVSAVLDFGVLAIRGDRRLDPLCSAAYLAPEITPCATARDWAAAQTWLAEHELQDLFEPTHRWLAAFWSGAVDDPRLQAWSRRVLGIPSST